MPVALEYMKGIVFFVSYAGSKEELMKFDFRYGPIRRQYDGVKYCKKKLEDVLYELSLGMNETNMSAFNTLDSFGPLALHEFKGLQDRMKEYDLLREKVIKESRDVSYISVFRSILLANNIYHKRFKNSAKIVFTVFIEVVNL